MLPATVMTMRMERRKRGKRRVVNVVAAAGGGVAWMAVLWSEKRVEDGSEAGVK